MGQRSEQGSGGAGAGEPRADEHDAQVRADARARMGRGGSAPPARRAHREPSVLPLACWLQPEEALEEFAILGRAIVRTWSTAAAEEQPSLEEIERLFAEIQAVSVFVAKAFRQHLLEDEQTEKRYLRLLHDPFLQPFGGEAPLSSGRLRKVLEVVMEVDGRRYGCAAVARHQDREAGDGRFGGPGRRAVRRVRANCRRIVLRRRRRLAGLCDVDARRGDHVARRAG